MLSVNQQENSSIMAEETYDSIKHMFNSYEYMVDGDFCTINKCETDDELVESVKCMKEISFCHSQHSTITTLNLAKYKLEQLQKRESQNIITKTIKKLQGKFRKIFYQ